MNGNEELKAVTVYDMSLCVRLEYNAHAMSNAGDNGSIRTLPRRQQLANGKETDAISGNLTKHYHAKLLTEYFEYSGVPLCPACKRGDSRRAAALPFTPELNIKNILTSCGVCDAHGFLITAKKGNRGSSETPEPDDRPRNSKGSLIDFSMALALPETSFESDQLFTRTGDSQMLLKIAVRSGAYALVVRYKAAGIGADTEHFVQYLHDEKQRIDRHKGILTALFNQITSPNGARMATLLPHLVSVSGAIAVETTIGSAVTVSPLAENYVDQLGDLASSTCLVFPFDNIAMFNKVAKELVDNSVPASFPNHKEEHSK